jgi:hypothetical protein
MLTTEDCERVLVESIVADVGIDDTVDALLSHLLSNLPGYSARSTDGLTFEHARVAQGHGVASGIVAMIVEGFDWAVVRRVLEEYAERYEQRRW